MKESDFGSPPNSVLIREMESGDLDGVIQLAISCHELSTGTNAPQFWGRQTLERWIHGRLGVLLVGYRGTLLVGFLVSSFNPDSRDAYINSIVVASQERGRGIGALLLTAAEAQLQNMGCNHIFGLIKPDNLGSAHLFQKRGFQAGAQFVYWQKTLGGLSQSSGAHLLD